MKILIIADNHLVEKSSVIRGQGDKFSDRLENQIKTFEWVNSFGLPVIHLGDFMDRPFMTAQELSAMEEIKPYFNEGWLFLRGNHEYTSSYDVLGALGVKENQIIRNPLSRNIGGLKALFLPFNSTEEDLVDCDIIFGHIGIKDIPYGAKGFDWDKIDQHSQIFLNGHLHNRYKFSDLKWNIGSLTAQNFSDDGLSYRKGAVILDTQAKTLEFVENPYAFNFYKFDWADYVKNYQGTELGRAIGSKTSCVSMSCPEGMRAKIQELPDFKDCYYLRIAEDLNRAVVNTPDNNPTLSVDHLQKFRDSFVQKYGSNTLTLQELAEVVK